MWRPWDVRAGPEGRTVSLPWIDGRDLLHGRVLLPEDGLGSDEAGLRILGMPKVIFRDLDWQVPRFLPGRDGAPSGLMNLGTIA